MISWGKESLGEYKNFYGIRIAMFVHALLDWGLGGVLFIHPGFIFEHDLVLSRIFASALFFIGGISWQAFYEPIPRKQSQLLLLKMIWSGSVWIGMIISVLEGQIFATGDWFLFVGFLLGFILWSGYYIQMYRTYPDIRNPEEYSGYQEVLNIASAPILRGIEIDQLLSDYTDV